MYRVEIRDQWASCLNVSFMQSNELITTDKKFSLRDSESYNGGIKL